MLDYFLVRFVSPQAELVYQKVIKPYKGLLGVVLGLLVADTIILLTSTKYYWSLIEIPLSLSLGITASWLCSRLLKRVFDIYLLDTALGSERRIDSELLILAKLLANLSIVVLIVIIFAETHNIDVFGPLASLGISGLAVVLAAQKTLEQLLGGIVIYLDRPFGVNDYISLPDGTFGRVESIGLRSTRIRSSDQGTLVVVPNSSLAQVSIKNFTDVKKVIACIYLNFSPAIPDEEQALIRQVILSSTTDIFGIDCRNTEVTFKDFTGGEHNKTQAQVTFFVLGSSEVSMGMRRQIINIALENIRENLKEYGVIFDIEEPTLYVDKV